MSDPVISFCIPVYNFAAFIPDALRSIQPQLGPDDEIVVFDGGSTDETPALMQRVCENDARVRYVRRDKRGGIDADIAACIGESRGRYFWLFSGDDVLHSGAVDHVRRALESGGDVHLLAHRECSFTLQPMWNHPVLRVDAPFRADLGRAEDRRAWLERAVNTEALFSFASSLVVRRAAWDSVPPREDFYGSGWAHAARLLEVAKRRLDVVHHPAPLIDRRGDNDSFRERGIVHRLSMAVDGYHRIAAEFARDRFEARHIKRLVRSELPVTVFIGAKEACRRHPERESRTELNRLMFKCHVEDHPSGWLALAAYSVFPPALETAGRNYLARRRKRAMQA